MSSLATYKLRLSKEIGDSETINKSNEQRTQAINDALRQIYELRNWPFLYENTTIQGVDGIFNIPRNMDKPVIIWYGENTDYYWDYDFINQTDFFTKYPYTVTITNNNDIQVIRFEDDQNLGHDVYNYTGTSKIGINDVAAREQIGQTFVGNANAKGVLLKLSTVGSPTGTLNFEIYDTTAGLPSGSALGTATLNINEITSDEEYHWAKFSSDVSITEGATYALVASASYSTSATDYVRWTYSTTSQITGEQVLYDGSTWSAGTGDQVFVICNNYYNFQYLKKFIDLEQSTDESGLPSKFDQAVGKMAAGILLDTKSDYANSVVKLYGIGGSEQNPTQNSAFGLLNLLWTKERHNAVRTNRRIKTTFEYRGSINERYRNNYYRR